MGMEYFVRQQIMMDNLEKNLIDLKAERLRYITELLKLDRMIERHESFLEKLQNDD